MKRWSGQIFPLVLLTALAALSFWLERAADLPESRHDGKLRHDPDSIVENFTVRRMNAQGQLQYRLNSPYMEHYADDDSSLIRQPQLVHYRPGLPDMSLTGQQALVTERGKKVYLTGNVVASRAAWNERPPLLARMPDLTVLPDDGTAFTQSPVEINEGPSWLRGIGMHLDNNTSTFILQSRVTGLMYPTRPQP